MAANFPSECLDEIFCHLDGEDLVACTAVCPEWNEFIGSTRTCMEKIKFEFSSCSRFLAPMVLTRSRRKYSCLKILGFYSDDIPEVDQLLRSRAWSHVICKNTVFGDMNQFLKFLQTIQFSVQKMFFKQLSFQKRLLENVGARDKKSPELQFP